MAMTAHSYKELYRNLSVPIVNENDERTGWRKVDVHKYLLSLQDNKAGETEHYNIQKTTGGLDELSGKIRDHFAKPNATLKVFVGAAEVEERVFRTANEAAYYAKKAFWGKGSPEEVQITLQLAMRFNLTTPERLQEYCDAPTDGLAQGRIGLDCNGFVGNYIEHGFQGKSWDDNKVGFSNYLANTGIADFMQKIGPEVESISDVKIFETYVMGLADSATGQVINRFLGEKTGHIVVTTPMTFFGMHEGKPRYSMLVVESTTDAGLTESQYLLLSGSDYVFKVLRGSKKGTPFEKMNVRMRPIK